jgi:2'-5' RNA ligase
MQFQPDRFLRRDAQPLLHSLFFAVVLDPEPRTQASLFTEALTRHHVLRGAPRPSRNLHVSLLAVTHKTLEQPSVEEIGEALQIGERHRQSPFKAQFNAVESWDRKGGGQWPLVLVGDEGVIGFERLHEGLALGYGIPPDPNFKPHLTLMWGRDTLAPARIRALTFTVREFVLVHSHVGAGHYDIKARFPLVYG